MSNLNLLYKKIGIYTWGGAIVLLSLIWSFWSPPVWSADEGTYFEVKDDLIVSGTEGTKNDADLEVKGASSFAKDVFLETGVLASPYGGLGKYENILAYSEQFDNAVWTRTGIGTITTTNNTAPDGIAAGDTIPAGTVGTDNIAQTGTGTSASKTFTGSVWLKTSSGTASVKLRVDSGNETGTAGSVSVTTDWKRFSVSQTFTAGSTGSAKFVLNNGINSVIAWGAQLEESATAGVYVETQTSAVSASRGVVTNADLRMLNLSIAEAGNLSFGGDAVLQRSSADTIATGTGDNFTVNGNLTVTGNSSIGTVQAGTWQGTAVTDTYVADALTISGGTINNTAIGGTVSAAGTFTNLTASGTLSLPNNSITDAMVSNTLTASDLAAGSAVVADSEVVDTLTISGGTINNTVIGGTVSAAGTFTNLTASGTVSLPADSITDAMVVNTLTASNYVPLAGGVNITGALNIGTTSGNVGIGTAVPGNYKLNVNGPVNISGALDVTGTVTAAGLAGATSTSGTSNQYFAIDSDFSDVNPELRFQTGSGAYKSIAYDETNTEFDFNDDINLSANALITTGNLSDGTNTLTVANAKTAYDHSQTSSGSVHGLTLANVSQLGSAIESSEITDGTITSTDINDGTIMNADVNTSAGIEGTKIAPDFGSQNIVTNGNIGIGTNVPIAKLDVLGRIANSGSSDSGRVYIQDILQVGGAIYASGHLYTTGLNATIGDYDGNRTITILGNPLILDTNSGDISLTPSGGNVYVGGNIGIGTTAPTAQLHAVDILSTATGNETAYQLAYTTNKATSGNDTGLLIAMTDTLSPGTSRLLDLQVGGGTKFNVDNAGNTDIQGNLVVAGDLTIQGTQTILNTQTVEIESNELKLNRNVTGAPSLDASIVVERGTSTDTYIKWDEANDKWVMSNGASVLDIANPYTAGDGLTLTGQDFDVNVDASTIEISGDTLQVKDSGITSAKIASDTIIAGDIAAGAVETTEILDGTIANVDINASAAIAGTKISPDFGSQNIITTGNVGIGTISPAENLHLYQTYPGGGNNIGIIIEDSLADASPYLRLKNNTKYWDIVNNGGWTGSQDSALDFNYGGASKITMLNNGNLGIGTTLPVSKLDVSGNTKITGNLEVTGTVTATGLAGATSTSGTNNQYFAVDADYNDVNPEIRFQTGAGTSKSIAYDETGTEFDFNDDINLSANALITTGNLSDGTNTFTVANAKTAYDHSQVSSGSVHGLTLANVSQLGSAIESAEITNDTIVNADINTSAGIAGTKISPDFGSQNIVTTGNATVSGDLTVDTNTLKVDSVRNMVGIGTIAPQASLDILGSLQVQTAGDVNIAHDLYFEDTSSAGINSYGPLTIQSGNPNSNYNLVLKGTGTGRVYVDDDLQITGDLTLPGLSIPSSGTITFGSDASIQRSSADTIATASGDSFTVNGNLTVTGNSSVGTVTSGTWNGTAVGDTYVADALTISGGTINNTAIGGTVSATGTFTNLTASGTVSLPADSITDTMVSNTLTASDLVAGSAVVADTEVVDALTISGGTINATSVGATVASTGAFTTLSSTQGTNLATASGNVGIGTTSPTFASGGGLQIKQGTQANLRLSDDGASQDTDLAQSGDDFYIINRNSGGELKFRVSGNTEAVTIKENGNVGIGTTVPGNYKLNVNGPVNIDGNLDVTGTVTAAGLAGATSTTGTSSQYFAIDTDYNEVNPELRFQTGSGAYKSLTYDEAGTEFDINDDVNLSANALITTGNLSDGTNTLTVANAKTAYDHSQTSSGSVHGLTLANVSQLGSAIESGEITNDTIVNADINTSAGIAGTKISPDFGSQNIITTGNIGIGTTAPAAKLHIIGATRNYDTGGNYSQLSSNALLFYQDNAAIYTNTYRLRIYGGTSATGLLTLGSTTTSDPPSGANIWLANNVELASTKWLRWTTGIIDNSGNIGIGTIAPASKLHGLTSLSTATGNETAYQLAYTTNKATSGNDTGLLIAMTDTLSPGTSRLLDLQVGGGTKFNVDNAGNTDIQGNLVVSGDLTIQGTQTILNTQTVEIESNELKLNRNVTGAPSLDASIVVERGTSTDTYIKWDEANDKWVMYNGTSILDIANPYTAGDGLTLTGQDFDVNVDASTIEINADALRVKDAGITSAKIAADTIIAGDIATGAVETTEILDGTIGNVDINASAGIAGTKIAPDFGTQVLVTTGNVGIGTVVTSSYKLNVLGNTNITGNLEVSGTVTATGLAGATSTSGTNNDTFAIDANYDGVNPALRFQTGAGTYKSIIYDEANTEFDFDDAVNVTGGITASNGLTISSGTVNLPADSVTDTMVSNTLTASDLVAGSAVVADSEVVDALTISGGAINASSVGATAASTGAFTTLSSTQGTNLATASGNVGIGTTSPGVKFHVSGGPMLLDNNNGYQTKDDGGIARTVIYTDAAGGVKVLGYHGNSMLTGVNGATYIYGSGGYINVQANMGIGKAPGAALDVSGAAYISGNVGIGTVAPTAALAVGNNAFKVASNGTVSAGTWQGTAVGDTYVADALTISGGTINNTAIGGTVSAAGTFTNLTASGTLSLPNNSVTDAMVSNTLTASDLAAGSAVVADSEVVDTLTISGGTINNTVIGGTVSAAGTFTNLTASGTVSLPADSITDAMVVNTLTASNYVPLAGGVNITGALNIGTTSGNVGIGTAVPGNYKLNVNGPVNISGALDVTGTVTAAGLAGATSTSGTSNQYFAIDSDFSDVNPELRFQTGSGAYKSIAYDETNTEFDFNDDINVTGGVTASNGLTVSAGTVSLPADSITDTMISNTLTASDLAAGSAVVADSEVVDALTISGGTINATSIGATVASTGAFTTLSSTQGTTLATASGNVGIGTAGPNLGKVQVAGGVHITNQNSLVLHSAAGGGENSMSLWASAVDGAQISGVALDITSTSSGGLYLATGDYATGYIRFAPKGAEMARISANGGFALGSSYVGTDPGAGNMIISSNVGIGTIAPTSKLHGLTAMSTATGNEIAYQLAYTTNKATSGNDTGLLIAMTDTLSPGTSRLLDLQVGGGTKFNVDNAGNTDIQGNLIVSGDLTIQGTQTILNTQTVEIESNELKLNRNVTGAPSLDASIVVERGTSTDTYIKWDEANDKWVMSNGTSVLDIANPYTAGDGLTLTGQDFDVNTDNSTIEISGDTLQVKDSGITSAKIAVDTIIAGDIATGAVETTEILDGTIANADVNTSAGIAGTKIAPDFGSQVLVTTGNVGIGTVVTSSYKLNVLGNTNITGNLEVSGTVTATGLAGATSTSGTNNDTFAIDANYDGVNPALRFQTGAGTYKSIIYDETNTEFDFDDAVNVTGGITASNGLTVSAGTVSLPADSITDAMVSNTLTASDLTAGSAVVADSEVVDALTISGGTINATSIGATVASTGAFTTLSSTGAANLAIISGNVGIGTTNPVAKLEILGGDVTVLAGNMSVPAVNKVNLEGSSGDTYITRSSANTVSLYVDGSCVAEFVKK